MKLTCNTENLTKSLSIVIKAVPIKHSFPILTNVLLEAKEGKIKLSGTNFDTSISTFIGASIEEEGSITVPAREFLEFLSHLSSENVEIAVKKDVLHISSGKTKSKFNGITAEDYPELPSAEEGLPYLEIAPKDFSSAVSHVGFSVASDDSRPVFGGILIRYDSGKLFLVASDGYRLSERVLEIESSVEDFSVIVPAKTVLEVSRILGSSEFPIKISVSSERNLCVFESGDIVVSTRIIDGTYPDYKRIIPAETPTTAVFEANALHEAVKLTNVFTRNSSNSLTLHINPEGFIKVYSTGEEVGENNTEVPAEVEGEEIQIMFNSKYLLEFLSNNKYEKLLFGISTNSTPCVVKPVDVTTFIHVLAPLNSN